MSKFSTGFLVSAMLVTVAPATFLVGASLVSVPAMADDDDGGGDDDGGAGAGNAGGGGKATNDRISRDDVRKRQRHVKRKKQVSQKRATEKRIKAKPRRVFAQRQTQFPLAAPNEILVSEATSTETSVLVENGFLQIRATSVNDGKVLARFRIPLRTSLKQARIKAKTLLPRANVDFNHYFRNGYKVQSGPICKGDACKHFNLVGWRADIAACDVKPEIGIIDTWVDRDHPALAGAAITVLSLPEERLTDKGSGHGTSVAALLVGNPSGPAPGLLPKARLATVNVFDTSAHGDERTDAYRIAAAIDALQKRGTQIVNLSLAGPENAVLKDAVTDAAKQGMVLVAAAGNAGPRAAPAFPAAYDEVIAVTAVSETLKVYRRANQGKHIDLAAPGVQIPTAGNNKAVATYSGSSFAVPFVTAAAAVQFDAGNMKNVGEALKLTAKDLGAIGPDAVFGAGLVQFNASCKAAP